MAILSPIDSPIQQYDPTQPLHTPNGVLPPIMSGGEIANSPLTATTADEIGKRGLLNHQLGKDIFNAEKPPDPTAAPGTIDWYKQRGSQIEYQKDHPYGSPVSAHPGVLGKILHGLSVAENIAGDVIEPGIMANVPGTELHNRLEEGVNAAGEQRAEEIANQTKTAESGAENADTNQERADTEKANEEKPAKLSDEEQTYASLSGKVNPATNKPYTPLEAYQTVKQAGQKPEKETPAHVTYDQGIPVTVTGADGKVYDVNDPKLPPELKPLVDSANRAHGQHQTEEAQKQAAAAAQQEKMFDERQQALTAATKSMVESAPGVLKLSARVRQLVNAQKDSLGPEAGRWSEFMAGKVGAPNPEFTKLRTDVGLLTTKLMRMHVGARGGELMMQHFKDLIDTGKQSPENLLAALDEIDQYAKDTMAETGKGGGENQPESNAPPAGAKVRDYTTLGK